MTEPRRLRSALLDLSGGILVTALSLAAVSYLLEHRWLAWFVFAVPALGAAVLGYWRGRQSSLPPIATAILINLLPLALVAAAFVPPGYSLLMILPAMEFAFSSAGIAVARRPHMPGARKRRLIGIPLAAVNLALLPLIPRFITSMAGGQDVREPAPAFQLSAPGGGIVDPASLPGKIVLIDFWATWCTPCRRELPEIDRLRTDLRGRGDLVILAVNADVNDTPERARAYFREKGFGLPMIYDRGSSAYKAFGSPGLPAVFVIDRAGRLRLRHVGYLGAEDFRHDLEHLIDRLGREDTGT
jgi:cytochrome c biogenesis protein CcmG, thiol:disulfide interchange protein DsbE